MIKNKKLVLIGVLSGLAAVLALIEIPYPLAPWLKFDLGEIVVLYGVTLISYPAALAITVIKTFVHLVSGDATPYFIGEIAAFISAFTVATTFYLTKKLPLVVRLVIVVITFTLVMLTMNYVFITPIYAGYSNYTQLIGESNEFILNGEQITNASYLRFIVVTYLPFNLLKGSMIAALYYLTQKSIIKYFRRAN